MHPCKICIVENHILFSLENVDHFHFFVIIVVLSIHLFGGGLILEIARWKFVKKGVYSSYDYQNKTAKYFSNFDGLIWPRNIKSAIPLASMALTLDHNNNHIYKWRIASITCFFTQLFAQLFPNDFQDVLFWYATGAC